jgi:hypothetical protein
MYYFWLLFISLMTLSACVFGAAVGFKSINYGGIDPAFLGALIGAAGTIFAATIAYVAVRKQIDQANAAVRLGERLQAKFAAEQVARELEGLCGLKTWFDARLVPFSDTDETSDNGYLASLDQFIRDGGLVSFMGQAPPEFYGQAQEAFQRLNGVMNAVVQWKAMNPQQDQQAARRGEFNTSVRNAITAIRSSRDAVEEEIHRREAGVKN